MEEQLITFDTAKLAKDKDFDVKVETFYMGDSKENFLHNAGKKDNWNNHKCILNESELSNDYSAPTQSLLQKWLREIHNIFISTDVNYCYKIYHNDELFEESTDYHSYEKALEKGLQEALKLIEL